MNVSLTPELERLVNEKVESGLYQTASEVVREALRLLKERDAEISDRALPPAVALPTNTAAAVSAARTAPRQH